MATYQVTLKQDAYLRPGGVKGDTFLQDFSDEDVKRYRDLGIADFKKGSFGDADSSAPQSNPLTVASLKAASVDDVRANIDSGAWDADTVRALEPLGENRSTLLTALEPEQPAGDTKKAK